MCGIAGILNLNSYPVDRGALEGMAQVLNHRGPDGEGFYVDNSIGLAHKRLAIIDLSPEGHQPMCNDDKTLWIIHNGEIFNYRELKLELERLGHRFRSSSDTEVILRAYEEWGVSCLDRFNGMWAFAIWDKTRQELFLSRDRFGVKPLYYFSDGDKFIFASEIKALLIPKGVPRAVNERALFRYLAKGYGYVDTNEETFFSGIKQMRPGHYLLASREGMEYKRYWSLKTEDGRDPAGSFEEAAETFSGLLQDSVRLELRSDVPLGIALSGGLDSTTLAVIMSGLSRNGIRSFSVCFEEEGFNERSYIDEILKDRKFEPSFIRPEPASMMRELEKIIWHQDEPYSGPSVFSQWEVMRAARNSGVKVLLTGQGSDECLAGYHKYYPYLLADFLRAFRLKAFMENLSAMDPGAGYSKGEALRAVMGIAASGAVPGSLKSWIKSIAGLSRPSFIDRDFYRRNSLTEGPRPRMTGTLLDRELYDSLTISPLPALLHIDDRNSMAHSVESRPPFLDHRLVEFLFSLPSSMKIRNGYTKYILREAMKGRLPERIRSRRDKMGFVTPAKIWFRKEMKAKILEILHPSNLGKRKILDPKGVEEVLNLHFDGKGDHSFTIWSWVNLELWFRVFFDGGSRAQ